IEKMVRELQAAHFSNEATWNPDTIEVYAWKLPSDRSAVAASQSDLPPLKRWTEIKSFQNGATVFWRITLSGEMRDRFQKSYLASVEQHLFTLQGEPFGMWVRPVFYGESAIKHRVWEKDPVLLS